MGLNRRQVAIATAAGPATTYIFSALQEQLGVSRGEAVDELTPVPVVKRRCRPLMAFDATIKFSYGSKPHFTTAIAGAWQEARLRLARFSST